MEKLFNADFWATLLENVKTWIITELPGLLFILVLLFIALRVVRFIVKRVRKGMIARVDKMNETDATEVEKRIRTVTSLIQGALLFAIWLIFLMLALQKVGIEIGPLLAAAGILGLAVGFGAQELVRDFISGFFIILENHVRTGDVAIINGTGGLVERIDLRTITLRDFSGTVHVFQNGKISELSNMTKEWSAMVFDIGVAYKEDLDRVMEIMKEVGDTLKEDETFGQHILEPIEIFGVDAFSDSAIVIKARLKTKPIQQWTVGREYRGRLKKAFDANRIEIPFPHTTVYWGEEITPLELKMEK
jgi:small conductance mechanosensitive channel